MDNFHKIYTNSKVEIAKSAIPYSIFIKNYTLYEFATQSIVIPKRKSGYLILKASRNNIEDILLSYFDGESGSEAFPISAGETITLASCDLSRFLLRHDNVGVVLKVHAIAFYNE